MEELDAPFPSSKPRNMGQAARLALHELLRMAGAETSLVTIRGWSRARQASAYVWARAFLDGREDLPPPLHVLWKGGG